MDWVCDSCDACMHFACRPTRHLIWVRVLFSVDALTLLLWRRLSPFLHLLALEAR